MKPVLYDGTFTGFLTALFEVYEYKIEQPLIKAGALADGSLFSEPHVVHTNEAKANRVSKKLEEKISKAALQQLYKSFLSEITGIENSLLRYVQYVMSAKPGAENDYSHPDILMIQQTSKKVYREKHRMEAFVRFQLTKDGLYYSIIRPDYNVLPLISRHFKERYADQRWLIYDGRRKYGLYYDLFEVTEVKIDFTESSSNASAVYEEKEELYQELWKHYFDSVNIAARRNMKLHIQHVPKRYWKYLVEKQPSAI